MRLNIDSLRIRSHLVDAAEARNRRPAVAGQDLLDVEILAYTAGEALLDADLLASLQEDVALAALSRSLNIDFALTVARRLLDAQGLRFVNHGYLLAVSILAQRNIRHISLPQGLQIIKRIGILIAAVSILCQNTGERNFLRLAALTDAAVRRQRDIPADDVRILLRGLVQACRRLLQNALRNSIEQGRFVPSSIAAQSLLLIQPALDFLQPAVAALDEADIFPALQTAFLAALGRSLLRQSIDDAACRLQRYVACTRINSAKAQITLDLLNIDIALRLHVNRSAEAVIAGSILPCLNLQSRTAITINAAISSRQVDTIRLDSIVACINNIAVAGAVRNIKQLPSVATFTQLAGIGIQMQSALRSGEVADINRDLTASLTPRFKLQVNIVSGCNIDILQIARAGNADYASIQSAAALLHRLSDINPAGINPHCALSVVGDIACCIRAFIKLRVADRAAHLNAAHNVVHLDNRLLSLLAKEFYFDRIIGLGAGKIRIRTARLLLPGNLMVLMAAK